MASFTAFCEATGETTARFSADFSGGDASFDSYRYVRLYIEGVDEYIIKSSSKGGSSSSFSKTVRGLNPGTEYFWAARLGYDNGTDTTWLDLTDNGTFATEESAVEVEPWSWSRSNGSASASQTEDAYSAVLNGGKISEFSHRVWNDLVDKVDEVISAEGGSWSGNYASLSATKMTSSDREMTAKRFNSLLHNIERFHSCSSISTVSRGEKVYGSYFLNIADEINSWINSL